MKKIFWLSLLLCSSFILSSFATDFSGKWVGKAKYYQYDSTGVLSFSTNCHDSWYTIKQKERRGKFSVEFAGTYCTHGSEFIIIGGSADNFTMENGVLTKKDSVMVGEINAKGFKYGYKTCDEGVCTYFQILDDALLIDENHMKIISLGPINEHNDHLVIWDLYRQ